MLRAVAILWALSLMLMPAIAQAATPCEAMLGDIWGEHEPAAKPRTIDGKSIRSPHELAKAVGTGAVVQGGSFAKWDFRAVALTNACFVEADLKASNWDGARASGVGFIKSDLSGASMVGLRAPGVLFRDAILTNTKANKADFSRGVLEGGWFDGNVDGWVISGANLTGFTFNCGITLSDGCPLSGSDAGIVAQETNFTDARLSSFQRYSLDGIDLTNAVLNRTEIAPGQLASLRGRAISRGLVLVGGDMKVAISAAEAQAIADDIALGQSKIAGPSYDCARAATSVEKTICLPDNSDLADADRTLASIYGEVRQSRPEAVADQRQWLKQRDACMAKEFPSDCLRTAYSERRGVLLGALGERNWLQPGEAALFIEDELPVSDAMRASPLYRRLAPLLTQSSMAYAYVERGQDGRYAASGEAIGANAHSCTLGAEGMTLDPLSGWYAVRDPESNRRIRVIQVRGEWLEVYANGHPYGDENEGAADYASCGARAAFSPMRRIALPPEIMNGYAERAAAGY